MLFRGQAQTARGGEIERARIACDLSDDAGQIPAAHPLFKREQRILRRFGSDMDHPVAKFGRKPRPIRPPSTLNRAAILHPKHLTMILHFGISFLLFPRYLKRITGQCKRQRSPTGIAGCSKDFAVERLIGQTGPPTPFAHLGKCAGRSNTIAACISPGRQAQGNRATLQRRRQNSRIKRLGVGGGGAILHRNT